jgi:hercynine metabolism protein
MTGSWLEQLEARLEQQLEAFLQSNPEQERLLEEQEQRERQERLLAERVRLRQEAELQRQALLDLALEIRRWQERVERASGAGAEDLARRARRHLDGLMERGRGRWETLAALGVRFREVQAELEDLARDRRARTAGQNLEAAWADFEAGQELQELRRRLQL